MRLSQMVILYVWHWMQQKSWKQKESQQECWICTPSNLWIQKAVTACINEIGKLFTVEDHNILNGLGSAVCEVAAEMGKGIVKRIGVQDQYGQSAPYERLLAMNGITVENIVKTAEELQ